MVEKIEEERPKRETKRGLDRRTPSSVGVAEPGGDDENDPVRQLNYRGNNGKLSFFQVADAEALSC